MDVAALLVLLLIACVVALPVLLLVLIVRVVVASVTGAQERSGALAILRERFARGEISRQEYEDARRVLRH